MMGLLLQGHSSDDDDDDYDDGESYPSPAKGITVC